MSDEEDDYMSDKFLTNCSKPENDIRPGLIRGQTQKRTHEIYKRKTILDQENKKKMRSKKEIEKEALDEGLQQPISSDNKGFALLAKMGFNPGVGLGKSGAGRTEPVPIKIKNDRFGLGRQTALKEVAAMKIALLKEAREKALNTNNYRALKREQLEEKHATIDIAKSQRACYDLDSRKNVDEPVEQWFWPSKYLKKNEESSSCDSEESDDEDDDLSVWAKLQIITLYLRRTHFYCIWCGAQYNDENDLKSECPGETRDDH